MIEFSEDGKANLINVSDGDKFSMIFYHRWDGIHSAKDYVVVRALKRDVVCTGIINGDELRLRRDERSFHCYPIGSVEVSNARKEIALKNRIKRCKLIIEKASSFEDWDDEICEAIEQWSARIATQPSTASNANEQTD